jgi:hypothetical protein
MRLFKHQQNPAYRLIAILPDPANPSSPIPVEITADNYGRLYQLLEEAREITIAIKNPLAIKKHASKLPPEELRHACTHCGHIHYGIPLP